MLIKDSKELPQMYSGRSFQFGYTALASIYFTNSVSKDDPKYKQRLFGNRIVLLQ